MKRFLLLFIIAGCLTGCYNDKGSDLYVYPSSGNDTCSTTPTFAAVIQPIIAQNCAYGGCHDAQSTNGYFLDNYEHIQLHALNGELVGSITHAANYTPMPENLPMLSACKISEIEAWIAAGARNN